MFSFFQGPSPGFLNFKTSGTTKEVLRDVCGEGCVGGEAAGENLGGEVEEEGCKRRGVAMRVRREGLEEGFRRERRSQEGEEGGVQKGEGLKEEACERGGF